MRGDLQVQLVVDVPTKLTPTQEELLRRLAEEMGDTVEPPGGQGLMSAHQVRLLADHLVSDRRQAC